MEHEPLTATEHRKRWPAAVARVWDVTHLRTDADILAADRPGLHREHLFDFHDGLRLLASLDRYDVGRPVHLHVSAGALEGSQIVRKLKPMTFEKQLEVVRDRVRFLSGREIHFAYMTTGGVLHFFDPPLAFAKEATA